ncbi:MAG: DASS family sodium-coupled anion symporter [Rickettsiales bacterium]
MKKLFFSTLYNQTIIFTLAMLGFVLWNLSPSPQISDSAWHLFIIFILTIAGIIINPMPMGAVCFIGIAALTLTGTLTLENCLAGFGADLVWLVVFAFFISQGFTKTGLGNRIAYYLISIFGKSTLGLTYSLVASEFFLSPLIPSVTARGGGIIYPIAHSLSESFVDKSHKAVSNRTGGFIMQVCVQSNVITSSLFLTAMAANPLIVKLAKDVGVEITWASWAIAALVPGIINLVLMPMVLYFFYKPEITHSESAPTVARQKLEEMGKIKTNEMIMLATFFLLIGLWIWGGLIGVSATMTALIGFSILLVSGVLKWDDAIADKHAWHAFIWFATLVMMSGYLTKSGIISWFGLSIQAQLGHLEPHVAVIILSLIYFYMHYLFASITAHITVLFPTFLVVFIHLGVPPEAAALALGFMSILSGGITHFSIGSAPIYFGSGYMKTATWWKLGGIISVLNLLSWTLFAGLWWKFLGLY